VNNNIYTHLSKIDSRRFIMKTLTLENAYLVSGGQCENEDILTREKIEDVVDDCIDNIGENVDKIHHKFNDIVHPDKKKYL